MTTREEEIRSLEMTRDFLRSLLDPKKTPKVPKEIRERASACLRHYPLVITDVTTESKLTAHRALVRMNPLITQSRYGDKRTIECVDPEKGIFKVYGKSHFTRGAENMFDFEGGPMLEVGEQFYGLGTIAGLDTTKRDEDRGMQDTDACVYVSVDMNKKTILAFRSGEDIKSSKEKNTKSYMDSLIDLYNPKEPNDER